MLQEWKRLYLLERDVDYSQGMQFTSDKNRTVIGPTQWLAQETGIRERRIWGMMVAESRTVQLSRADRVLLAIGKQQYLTDGTLHVVPNPNWSFEKWITYMEERGCI